jgi:hypothetical protein
MCVMCVCVMCVCGTVQLMTVSHDLTSPTLRAHFASLLPPLLAAQVRSIM